MQDTGPVLQRLQMEAYRAVLRAMAVAPLQYVSQASSTLRLLRFLLVELLVTSCSTLAHPRTEVACLQKCSLAFECCQEQEKLLTNLRKELHVGLDKHTVSAGSSLPPCFKSFQVVKHSVYVTCQHTLLAVYRKSCTSLMMIRRSSASGNLRISDLSLSMYMQHKGGKACFTALLSVPAEWPTCVLTGPYYISAA